MHFFLVIRPPPNLTQYTIIDLELEIETLTKQIEMDLPTGISGSQPRLNPPSSSGQRRTLVQTVRRNLDGSDPYLSTEPFAKVEGALEGSPASLAGLITGDEILRYYGCQLCSGEEVPVTPQFVQLWTLHY